MAIVSLKALSRSSSILLIAISVPPTATTQLRTMPLPDGSPPGPHSSNPPALLTSARPQSQFRRIFEGPFVTCEVLSIATGIDTANVPGVISAVTKFISVTKVCLVRNSSRYRRC